MKVQLTLLQLLGAFTKLRKETTSLITSLCRSVRPPLHMELLGSHWTHFLATW